MQSQPLSTMDGFLMILFVLEDLKCIPSMWLITFLWFLVRSYVKILASYPSLGIYILFIRITKFLVRFHFWDTKGTSAAPISHQKKDSTNFSGSVCKSVATTVNSTAAMEGNSPRNLEGQSKANPRTSWENSYHKSSFGKSLHCT